MKHDIRLRAKSGVQLVLHQGAKPRSAAELKVRVADSAGLLEWKGPDRAVIVVRDVAHFESIRAPLEGIIARWAAVLP